MAELEFRDRRPLRLREVDVPAPGRGPGAKIPDYAGREVALGMRPESFFLPGAKVTAGHSFRAEVNLVEVLGAEALVHLTTDAAAVMSDQLADAFEDADASPGWAAFALLTVVPFVLVYLRIERSVVQGITTGSVK